ncbi:MAG TPA: hypothetical protein PLT64_00220 [Syntrophales bacterium]|nr:hypothetical protein [Syntrophales bacterium]HOL58276.1 hypothetical protein [Syntrophales bacterium]HPO34445.1 hypothetical protein [Syntrophales bacterium]
MKWWMGVVAIVICFFIVPPVGAQVKCVESEGEAVIVNNDIPSARIEAVARAKWQAIEKTVGVNVKAGSLVSNFTLVEDVIKTQVGGAVKSFSKKWEKEKDGVLTVGINACVEPTTAREAIASELSLNSGVAVFLPARLPTKEGGGETVEETNILSETLIEKLREQNYQVIDVASANPAEAAEVERAMKSGSTLALRSLIYKFLANVIVIGRTDFTISSKKGEEIGYGLSMPFNNVTARLQYRIVARNNKTGKMEILTAGTEQGKGIRNKVEDAAAEALKEVAEKITPRLLDELAKYIQGNAKKIRVKVNGVKDLDTSLEVKSQLQSIVWVTSVEEKELGEFIVEYPEKTLYLANSIQQKGNFSIVNFTPYSLTLKYEK